MIWNGGIHSLYLNNTAKRINNSFWSEILQSYVSFINKIHSKNQSNLLSTLIWYNEDINNGNLYIPTLFKRGYNFICDFVDDTGQPLSHQSLTNLTNTHVNWLDYIKLSTGINNFLRSNSIKNLSPLVWPIVPLYLKPILKKRKGSKDFYNIFRNNGSIPIPKG